MDNAACYSAPQWAFNYRAMIIGHIFYPSLYWTREENEQRFMAPLTEPDMKWTLQLANDGSKIVSFSLRGCYCYTEYRMDMTGKTLANSE